MRQAVALFGEAEKGEFRTPHYVRGLDELEQRLGEPPAGSRGLHLAIQALMFSRLLIFFRVPEEGICSAEYFSGLDALDSQVEDARLAAIGLPGVGDAEILDATLHVCAQHRSLLLFTESDLYDYLTQR